MDKYHTNATAVIITFDTIQDEVSQLLGGLLVFSRACAARHAQ